jgi:tRNA pseudouridine55 synthase
MPETELRIIGRESVLRDPLVARDEILSTDGAFLLLDKPYGVSSFYVVNRIRKAISESVGIRKVKCGHAGTLDPLATGLLIIATRHKTKEIGALVGLDKIYRLRMRFGITSASFDLEQAIEITGGESDLTEEKVTIAIESLRGTHQQIPPAFSAIKQKGRPVYLRARAGKDVLLAAREIVVHDVEVISIELPYASFRVRVSKGTYVRSIVRDIAESLGTGGILIDLAREAIGPYKLENALTLDESVDLARITNS